MAPKDDSLAGCFLCAPLVASVGSVYADRRESHPYAPWSYTGRLSALAMSAKSGCLWCAVFYRVATRVFCLDSRTYDGGIGYDPNDHASEAQPRPIRGILYGRKKPGYSGPLGDIHSLYIRGDSARHDSHSELQVIHSDG